MEAVCLLQLAAALFVPAANPAIPPSSASVADSRGYGARQGAKTGLLDEASVEVVVSWYNEDLTWLDDLNLTSRFPIKIYAKDEAKHPVYQRYMQEKLPNLGMESYVYIHHIIKNWDSLAECTIFVVAGVAKKRKEFKMKKMKYVLENLGRCQAEGVVVMADHTRGLKPQAMKEFQIKRWTSSSLAAGQRKRGRRSKGAHQLIPAVTRPFGAWYKEFMTFDPTLEKLQAMGWCYNGIFAASRATIRANPKEMYENLLKQLSAGVESEVNHYIERSWLVMFASAQSAYKDHCASNPQWVSCELCHKAEADWAAKNEGKEVPGWMVLLRRHDFSIFLLQCAGANDVNGMFEYKGVFHVFYQHFNTNDFTPPLNYSSACWTHVASEDLMLEGLRIQPPAVEIKQRLVVPAGGTLSLLNSTSTAPTMLGQQMEVVVVFERPTTTAGSSFGLRILKEKDSSKATVVSLAFNGSSVAVLTVDVSGSIDAQCVTKRSPSKFSGPLRLLDDEDAIELRVLVDRNIVEVFGQGGRTAITATVAPTNTTAARQAEVWAEQGGGAAVRSASVHGMRCMWA
eukprot:g2539.t1